MTGRDSLLWGRPSSPPDAARRSILHCLRMLAPFREALPETGFPASDMAEGERQFYAFIKGLYGEMYGDPAFFLVPEREYDQYMEEAGAEKQRTLEPHKVDQKECRLRNRFQQAIRFYAAYLYELGTRAERLENGVLFLGDAQWKAARKAVAWPHLRDGIGPRFRRLEALGLDEHPEPGGVYITNRDFPKMMYGLWALCTAPENRYRHMNYLRLDFAAALRSRPVVEDIFPTLSPERAAAVSALHNTLTDKGLKSSLKPLREITSGSRWKVEYRSGSKAAAGFYAGPDSLTFCLYFGNPQRISEISALLGERDPALREWLDVQFQERLCQCPNNCRVELGNGPRRICGLSCRADLEEPRREDVKRFLALFHLLQEEKTA